MVTKEQLEALIALEDSAYRAYLEAHLKANSARKEFGYQALDKLGVEPRKTPVYVLNFNGEDTRCIVREITKEGKAACFPCNENGQQSNARQAACCHVDEIRLKPLSQE